MIKPMLAFPLEAEKIDGWMMSEKLDGVRAIWDSKTLRSRNGGVISAPSWFTADLPSVTLDGELWGGRGKFQSTAATVGKKKPVDREWEKLRFMVFDVPEAHGGFECRIETCSDLLKTSRNASVCKQVKCSDRAHLEQFMAEIVNGGGEGVVLRAPGSIYENKRSRRMLKYKADETDEGTVNAVELRALTMTWRGGDVRIGLPVNAPTICPGETVTFSFCGFTDSGMPRFAKFLCVRDYE